MLGAYHNIRLQYVNSKRPDFTDSPWIQLTTQNGTFTLTSTFTFQSAEGDAVVLQVSIAQNAGALAVLIVNTQATGFMRMSPDTATQDFTLPTINIPSASLPRNTGTPLVEALSSGQVCARVPCTTSCVCTTGTNVGMRVPAVFKCVGEHSKKSVLARAADSVNFLIRFAPHHQSFVKGLRLTVHIGCITLHFV
jgi:hypothetical protein